MNFDILEIFKREEFLETLLKDFCNIEDEIRIQKEKDDYIKKELSDRWNELIYKRKKIQIQRDLYSAFLIKNSDNSLSKPNIKMCKSTFNEFVLNHNKCIDYVKENNKNRLSCFGF